MGFPGGASNKEPACQCRRGNRPGFHPWVQKIGRKRAWQLTSVSLPGESHGQSSPAGYTPLHKVGQIWSNLASARAGAHTHTHTHTPASPVQFSCSILSNPVTPWTAAHQASLSITNSLTLLKIMSIELVMPSNHLILCHPLLLPPSKCVHV